MLLSLVIVSFVAGALVTLLVQYAFLRWRFLQLPVTGVTPQPQFSTFQLPQSLLESLDGNVKKKDGGEGGTETETKSTHSSTKEETCLFLNLVFQFLFKELKDTARARRWMVKKMNVEFNEMLQTTTGKLLDGIQVREFNLGAEFPVVQAVRVQKVELNGGDIETLDVGVNLDYNGGFQLAVDVDLVFGTWAYLSVKVTKLKGRARLQLCREPFTHWSFAFCEEPKMEFEVDSRFNGRPIPQITSLIVNQIKRTLRKKHILPNYKMRFKPFFMKTEVSPEVDGIYLKDSSLTLGSLDVRLVKCSRLAGLPPDSSLYCTMSVDPYDVPEIGRRSCQSLLVELHVPAVSGPIGLNLKDINSHHLAWETTDRPVVVVDSITSHTPASQADIRKGDIVDFIGNVRVLSSRQAAKQIKNAGERISMHIRRSYFRTTYQAESEEPYDIQDEERVVLCGDLNDDPDDFVNITFKPEDRDASSEEVKSKVVSDRPKFINRAIPQKGLSLLSAGRKKLLGRKEQEPDAKSPITSPGRSPVPSPGRSPVTSPDRGPIASLGRSPSTSPILRRKSVNEMESVNSSRSQSFAAVVPRKVLVDDGEGSDRSQSAKSSPQKQASELRRIRAHSDTSLNKLSDGDTGSLGGEFDSGTDTPEEACIMDERQSKRVPYSETPVWNELFQLGCEEEHKFINVCLWSVVRQKLDRRDRSSGKDADRADRHHGRENDKTEKTSRQHVKTMIGYVSLPLTDVVLGCLMTVQGDFLHTAYLNSPEPQASASRTKRMKPGQLAYATDICHGDITLMFHHHPARPVDPAVKKKVFQDVLEPQNLPHQRQSFPRDIDRMQQSGQLDNLDQHDFVATQFPSGTHCHFCGKKIWFKGAFQCSQCTTVCHKKCVQKCQLETICTKDGMKLRSHSDIHWVPPAWQDEGEKSGEKGEAAKSTGLFSKLRRDAANLQLNVGQSKTSPQVSPQPSPTPSPGTSPVPSLMSGRRSFSGVSSGNTSEGMAGLQLSASGLFRSSSSSSVPQLFGQGASPAITPTDNKDGDSEETDDDTATDREVQHFLMMARQSHDKGLNLDDMIVIQAKEKGRELYSHLSLPDRKQTLDDMVTKLQHALDKESEHKSELTRALQGSKDESQKRLLKLQLDKSDEKMEALMMMMVHYCAGLQHCLDLEEEEERKRVPKHAKKVENETVTEECGIELVITKDSPKSDQDEPGWMS